ncbi:hypothetical protein SAMN02745857_04289 [Andreprevotia lacus DSM 23236]|jgi:hypothetical protein|uniref:Uncharacterized protein n=1 Tax=Andreprevotia lacus DSM 23236 TaxID=1121001 RepID=A0A1W1Y1B9_9NEIS|nr:hypothetical protein [Andreprevotia lacus]SMC29946.1 hypothetical protein SAMN02745857_04289 [Andreprevotia lacus DSM 23236]
MNAPHTLTKAALFHDLHTGQLLRQRALLRLAAHAREDLLLAAQLALQAAGNWRSDVTIPIQPRGLGRQRSPLKLIREQITPTVWFADGQYRMSALETLYFFADSYERVQYLHPLLPAFGSNAMLRDWLGALSSRPFMPETIAVILARTAPMARHTSALLAMEMDREAWVQGLRLVPPALAEQLMRRFDH